MASHCEKCGTKLASRKDRFCPIHARQLLRRLDQEGYLQPLKEMTSSGVQVLSEKQFLTINDPKPDPEAS